MAANKFATMLARNTNKVTVVLTYAMLEWILIVLLLLNSLFSYLIIKFSDYFGLKRPCLWCSRLDHFLEPTKNSNSSYRDLVCESHANEISKLGYCSNHRKLAESKDMCEDCSSKPDCEEWSNKFAYFPWMKKIGVIQGVDGDKVTENREEEEEEEEELNCSCCGLSLNRDLYSSCIVIKPPWGGLDYTQKPNLTLEARGDGQIEEGDDHADDKSGRSLSDFVIEKHGDDGKRVGDADANSACSVCEFGCKGVEANGDEKVDRVLEQQERMTDANLTDDQPQHLEFYIDQDDCRLVLVDMIDSPTSTENQSQKKYVVEDQGNSSCEDVIMDFSMCFDREDKPVVESWRSSDDLVTLLSCHESKEDSRVSVFGSKDSDEDVSSSILQGGGNAAEEENELVADSTAAMARGEIDLDVHQAAEEDVYMCDDGDEIDAEVSIGTDIPDQDPVEEILSAQELLHSSPSALENPSTSTNVDVGDDRGSNQAEEELLEFHTLSVRMGVEAPSNRFLLYSELDEIEEEKVPNTPTSIDSLHQLQKGLPFFDRRELGTEEPLDESVTSDVEGADGGMTVEKLKTALRAERKALNEVYAELEEERSASAVAASQTMAMINRLQEEKAAMQMEALQYQRMMDEQSEYDQEAMQLLNELMVKREKEKQELEKELEVCRKKIQEYEAKEKMMFLRRMKDGSTRSRTSSGACSNAEDSDGLSTDLNNELKEEDSVCEHDESSNQNTPTDAVLYLEESLASFEEEKLSILDQLKELEEKLLTLNDEEEEEHYEDIKSIEHFSLENGNGYHEMGEVSSEVNGAANGHSIEMNGNHHQDRKSMAKRLLPLFDAMDSEGEDGILNGNSEGFDSVASQDLYMQFEEENKKLAIEEEVGHVYERLQALEADREFLKHCISSLRKGDKGLVLLQEILQHLRDLRSVEVRLRNSGEGVL